MIGDFSTQMPDDNQVFIDTKTGRLTVEVGRRFLQFLFNRTGMGPGIPETVNLLDASGALITNAQELYDDINVVTSTAGGVRLSSSLRPGMKQWVYNEGPNPLSVFPFSSAASIDALAAGVAYSLAANKAQVFTCITLSRILSLQLG